MTIYSPLFTPYYRLSRLQNTQAIGNTENKQVKRNMSKYFQRMFMLISLSLGYLFYDTYSYFFVNKWCIDNLLCMVDVFRLSGTTDEAIIDDRRQDINGNREQILLSIWFSETASGISKKLDRKQVLNVFSLKLIYNFAESPHGCILSG